MSEERFLKIEHQLSAHDKDIHSIAKSLEAINKHMEKSNQLQQQAIVTDTKINARIERMEERLSAQIKNNTEATRRAHERTDKIDSIINRLAWTVISLVLLAMVGTIIKVGV